MNRAINYEGLGALSPRPIPHLVRHVKERKLPSLSALETEMLHLVCAGYTQKEAGRLLGLSEGTIKTYLYRTRQKMDVRTTGQLVAEFCRGNIQ